MNWSRSSQETILRRFALLVFIMAASALSLALATVAVLEEKGILYTVFGQLLSSPVFQTPGELVGFLLGAYLLLLLLLFLDPMNTASAILLSVASVVYLVTLWAASNASEAFSMSVEEISLTPQPFLVGVCVALLVAKGHKWIPYGVLKWKRRRVRYVLEAILVLTTIAVVVDYWLTPELEGLLLNAIPAVMFIYVMSHALSEEMHHSVVVIGPRRSGKTTFVLGLVASLGREDDTPDAGDPDSLLHCIATVADEWYRTLVDWIEGLRRSNSQTGPPRNLTDPLKEMLKALHEEHADGWGEFELDQEMKLGKPLPDSMYVQLGFNITSNGVPRHRVRFQTIDARGDHYDENLAEMIEECWTLKGRVERLVAWVTEDGLDEYGYYDDEQSFKRHLARQVASADTVVTVVDAKHLTESPLPRVDREFGNSTAEYGNKIHAIVDVLSESSRVNNLVVAVTKADLIRDEIEGNSRQKIQRIARERLTEENAPDALAPIGQKVDDDQIYPVFYEMNDDGTGARKPLDPIGFKPLLDTLVNSYV